MNTIRNYYITTLFLSILLFAVSCEVEEEVDDVISSTSTIAVGDQNVESGSIYVSKAVFAQDGFITAYLTGDDGLPDFSSRVAEAVKLPMGFNYDVTIPILDDVNIENGTPVSIVLHSDTGTEDVFEFTESNELDPYLTKNSGAINFTTIVVGRDPRGSLSVQDQMIMDNTISVESITLDQPGWVVVHKSNEDGSPQVPDIVSEPVKIGVGDTTDVIIQLDSNENFIQDEKLWVMLHTDNGTEDEYEFDGGDIDPPIFDEQGDIVMKSIEISVDTLLGSLSVTDQILSQNAVMVESIFMNKNGWAVIHRDNGSDAPVVPDIIGKVQVEAGENANVAIPIDDGETISDDEKLWVMLHTDDGDMGEYEFDGNSGLDKPLVDSDGEILMSQIEIEKPYFDVGDQAVTNNKVFISEVYAAVDGWLVIHNQDDDGNIVVPDIIGKVMVNAGMNENVVVQLDEDVEIESGQSLFPMLHIDTGQKGVYEFDGNSGLDLPEVFSFNGNDPIVLVDQIEVQ